VHIHDERAGCGPHNLYYDEFVSIAQPLQRRPPLIVIWHLLDVFRRLRLPLPHRGGAVQEHEAACTTSYSADGASPKAREGLKKTQVSA
jgi:hypothetical protein